jgi:putative ABC transport system permease protein
MGTQPIVGRTFSQDEAIAGHGRVAVIGSRLWQERFNSDAAVAGRSLRLDGLSFAIIGVVDASFGFPEDVDIWIPTAHDAAVLARFGATGRYVLGRLANGTTLSQINQQQQEWLKRTTTNREGYKSHAIVSSLHSELVGETREPLLVVVVAVALVFGIGITNIVFWVVGRISERRDEFAIRIALGVTKGRLLKQLFLEHFIICVAGAVLSIALAWWGLRYLGVFLPPEWPQHATVQMNSKVLAFSTILLSLTSMLLGVFPTGQVWRDRDNIARVLTAARHTEGRPQRYLRHAMIAGQVAFVTLPLMAAGAAIQELRWLYSRPLGFVGQDILCVTVSRPETTGKVDRSLQRRAFMNILESLREMSGLQGASGVDNLPSRSTSMIFRGVGTPADAGTAAASPRIVAPSYFSIMRIRLLDGRDFTLHDDEFSEQVVIVNSSLARRIWPGEVAVGRTLKQGPNEFRVVGVVDDVRFFGPASEPALEFYRPIMQATPRSFTYVLRGFGPTPSVLHDVRARIIRVGPDQAIEDITELDEFLDKSVQMPRSLVATTTVLAAVALLLVTVGIYATVSHSVNRAAREFSIRLALGAKLPRLVLGVLVSSLAWTGVGVVVGVAGFWGARAILGIRVAIHTEVDWAMVLFVALLLCLVSALTSLVAARVLTRLDIVNLIKEA